jgi:uncharacterized membrane protein
VANRAAPSRSSPRRARPATARSAAGGTRAGSTEVPVWLIVTSLTLCLLGLGIAGYLSYEHHTAATTLACPDTGTINCVKVTTSSYSRFFGMPVSDLGLAFFAVMTVVCFPMAWRAGAQWVWVVRLAVAAGGVAFALYLVWAELFQIDAICLWCTAVHVVTVALFAVVAIGSALLPTRS